jgi:hypothetical protein
MLLEITLPMVFRGKPLRMRSQRHIHAVMSYSTDVVEVTKAETSLAMEAHSARNLANEEIDAGFELRTYNGRLYRALNTGGPFRTMFSAGFSNAYHSHETGLGTLISPGVPLDRQPINQHPLSQPLENHFGFQIAHRNLSSREIASVFPDVTVSRAFNEMNLSLYTDVRKTASDLDAEDIDLCLRMHGAQMERLLFVDGKPWVETPPPCFHVTSDRTDRSGGSGYERKPLIMQSIMPAWIEMDMRARRFPLADRAAADRYAEFLRTETVRSSTRDAIVDRTVRIDIHDPQALEFDATAKNTLSMGVFLAQSCMVGNLSKRQSTLAQQRLSDTERSLVQTCEEEIAAINPVLGHEWDARPILEDLAEIWRKLDWPMISTSFSGNPMATPMKDYDIDWFYGAVADVVTEMEAGPISIHDFR